jgi:hypothetical protein
MDDKPTLAQRMSDAPDSCGFAPGSPPATAQYPAR